MKQAFASGRVMNGRLTVTTTEGDGYSRPIATREPVVIPAPVEEPLEVPGFMKRWMDQKTQYHDQYTFVTV